VETVISGLKALPDDAQLTSACTRLLDSVTLMQRMAAGNDLDDEAAVVAEQLLEGKPLQTAAAPAAAEQKPSASAASDSAAIASVRVESRRLDRLAEYAGELLAMHARLTDRDESLQRFREALNEGIRELPTEARTLMNPLARNFERLLEADRGELERFGRLTSDLGEAMKHVRMMRLSSLAPTWRQLVRESAQKMGRQIELEVDVGEIELDKFVLDQIRDPVIHLLRNAVAHGIEPSQDRLALGKRDVGKIAIAAGLNGAMVRLEVSDDGRGLDPRYIGERAVRKGLLEPARLAQMAPTEVVELIFQEGFTTAENVGSVSGRGVGLGVVKSQITALGGRVAILLKPTLGGSTFELTFPVSVVSRKGLLVRSRSSVYALPIEQVMGTVRISRRDLQTVDGEPVWAAPGTGPLKLRWLSRLMGQPPEATGTDRLKVVVLSWGEARLGLIVGEVLGGDEYVVKRLPSNLGGIQGVDGAVILADGSLAVALNVQGLFAAAASRSPVETQSASPSEAPPKDEPARAKRILVVDDQLTTRAVHRSLLESCGHQVVLAADGEEAWEVLQREPFDLLVSDVQMPRLDGYALTARIRQSTPLKDLPVILVTARGTPEDIAAGAKAGANEYLVKGQYESEKLLASIRRFT
jgi:two-component system chemotaxis sensor kinase CheA